MYQLPDSDSDLSIPLVVQSDSSDLEGVNSMDSWNTALQSPQPGPVQSTDLNSACHLNRAVSNNESTSSGGVGPVESLAEILLRKKFYREAKQR